MHQFRENKYPHIKYGFRGEGIIYQLENKEIEFGCYTTWMKGCRIYLDDVFTGGRLSETQKRTIFEEVIGFSNWNKEKPIIVYTSDMPDSKLWQTLCYELRDSIKGVETSTSAENEQARYNMMKKDLETGRSTYNIDGWVLKTVEDLDQYWAEKNKKS